MIEKVPLKKQYEIMADVITTIVYFNDSSNTQVGVDHIVNILEKNYSGHERDFMIYTLGRYLGEMDFHREKDQDHEALSALVHFNQIKEDEKFEDREAFWKYLVENFNRHNSLNYNHD